MEPSDIGFLNNLDLGRLALSAETAATSCTAGICLIDWLEARERVERLVRSLVEFGFSRSRGNESEVIGTRAEVSVSNEMFGVVCLVPDDDICLVSEDHRFSGRANAGASKY